MTFQSLIFDVQNLITQFLQPDDNKLSDRQVAFWINHYRSKLIKQALSKGEALSEWFYQTLPILEIEKVTTELGDCLYRSKLPLPQPVFSNLRDMLSYVGPPEGSKNFDELKYQDLQFIEFSKYAKRYPHYCIRDRYLYIYYPPTSNLSKVMVRGVFEEPEKLGLYSAFTGFDFEYPVPGYMIDTIKKLIIDSELKLGLSVPKDDTNDGN